MDALVISVLWVASLCGGWRIMGWKNRWEAFALCLFLGPLGLLFALFLDVRCPHCRELMNMAADVCPHCGRNKRDGKVTVRG